MTSQHCSVCSSTCVAYFCTCAEPEVCLCSQCSLKHVLKVTREGHALRPISLLKQYRCPLFLARCKALPFVFQQTYSWVDDLETVITEFTQRVQATVTALTSLCQEKTAQLRQIKAELTTGVAEALEEVERTLGEEKPQLQSRFGAEIRAMVEQYKGESTEGNGENSLEQTAAYKVGSLAGTVPGSIAVLRSHCSLLPSLSCLSCPTLSSPAPPYLQAIHLSLNSLVPLITQQLQLDAQLIHQSLGGNLQINQSCTDRCDLDFISDLEAAVESLLKAIRETERGGDFTADQSCICSEQLSMQMEKTVRQEMQILELLGLPNAGVLGPNKELTGREKLLRQQHCLQKGLKAACKHLKVNLGSCFQQVMVISHYTADFLCSSSASFLRETVEGVKRDQETEGDRLDQVVVVLELLAGLQSEWQTVNCSLAQLKGSLGASHREGLQGCVADLQANLEEAVKTLLRHSRYLDAFVPAGEAKQRSVAVLCELETAQHSPSWPLFFSILQHLTTQQALINPFLAAGDYLETAATAEPEPQEKQLCAVPSALDRINTGLEYLLRDIETLEKSLEIPTDLNTQLREIKLVKGQEGTLLRQSLIHSKLAQVSTSLSASDPISKGMNLLLLLAMQVHYLLYHQSLEDEEVSAIERTWGQEKLIRQQAALFKALQSILQVVEAGRVVPQAEDLEDLAQRSLEVVGAFQLAEKQADAHERPCFSPVLQRRTILHCLSSLETHAHQIRDEQVAVSSLLSQLKAKLEASQGAEFTTDWSAVADSPLCDQIPVLIDHIGKHHFQLQSPSLPRHSNEAFNSGVRVKAWSDERDLWVLLDIPPTHILKRNRKEQLTRRASLNTELTLLLKDLCKSSARRSPYANSRKPRHRGIAKSKF